MGYKDSDLTEADPKSPDHIMGTERYRDGVLKSAHMIGVERAR